MKKIEDAVHTRWRQMSREFGEKLRSFRDNATQRDFAKRLNISVRVLIDLEGGKYKSPAMVTHLQNLNTLTEDEKHKTGISDAHDFIFGSAPRPNHILDFRQRFRTELSAIACSYYRHKGLANDQAHDTTQIPILTLNSLPCDGPMPLSQIDSRLVWKKHQPTVYATKPDMATMLKERSPSLYPGSVYRFLGVSTSGELEFCSGDYYSFLNSCEVLSFELAGILYKTPFCYDAITRGNRSSFDDIGNFLAQASAKLIPLRHKAEPLHFHSRCTAFGTCALVVIKRTNKAPQMVLNVRSGALAETPGLTHVIPAGTFQPNCHDDRFHTQEFSLSQNLIRELIEEMLEDKHMRGDPGELTQFESMFSGRGRQFWDLIVRENKFVLLYLGTLLDPVNLKPETVCVFFIHEGFLNQVTHKLYKTFETGNFRMFDFSLSEIERRIVDPSFVPTGRAHLRLVKEQFNKLQDYLSLI